MSVRDLSIIFVQRLGRGVAERFTFWGRKFKSRQALIHFVWTKTLDSVTSGHSAIGNSF